MSNYGLGASLNIRISDDIRRGLDEAALGSGRSVSDVVRDSLAQFSVDASRGKNAIFDAVPGFDRPKVQMLVADAASDRKCDVANAAQGLAALAAAYSGQMHHPGHDAAERAAYGRAATALEGVLAVARHRLERT
jgi:hypothetical protein